MYILLLNSSIRNFNALLKYQQKLKGLFFDSPGMSTINFDCMLTFSDNNYDDDDNNDDDQ